MPDIKLDPSKITLGDMLIFEPSAFSFTRFVEFLEKHSGLSRAEIESIPLTQLRNIMEQIAQALREIAVPKANATSSSAGPQA